ncbi:Protein tyrosine kinase/Protein kinase domain containing protein, putative, partial [Leishmania lindenbergi]
ADDGNSSDGDYSDARPPHVRILDFGLACGVEEVGPELRRCVGTPHYMAPETFPHNCDCDVPAARDVWSLGVTLFRLSTGVFPAFGCDAVVSWPPANVSSTGLLPLTVDHSGQLLSEFRAMPAVSASILAVNLRRRPTIARVLLHLQGIGEVVEPVL